MFKHRDVPHCPRCRVALVLHAHEADDTTSTVDLQWKCQDCGSQRPLVYLIERSLKKTA